MTDPAHQQSGPRYADRVHRSVPAAAAGVLLLALALWLAIDAMVRGTGRDPWLALATLALVVPLVTAYTLWPQVRLGRERLVVRNPLRTITVPWRSVDAVEAEYSVELHAGGRKYQIWAVPVSLRQRKRAQVRFARAAAGADPYAGRFARRGRARDDQFTVGGPGLRSALRAEARGGGSDPARAWSDRVVDEMREYAEAAKARQDGAGEVGVAWTWWVIAPAAAGAAALVALLAA